MIQKFLFLFLCVVSIAAQNIQVVPIAKKDIQYKSKIYTNDVLLVQVNKKYNCNKYLNLIDLKKNKYYATHYIAKNRVICFKDVTIPEVKKVKFRFGNLEIEKEAELIKETKSYIKIKNLDGTIEKIYTDGRN
ncbi:hypothetical protein [Arcobacter sp. 15-2]|uniref:hypothetical protein n=1 Tax=Arcobacter sp. 15-2 TaxID=3374109 RepID=UPI00399D2688